MCKVSFFPLKLSLTALFSYLGLDPAGPWFKKDDPRVCIDKDDGQFVDIHHSSGGRLALGVYENIGDVDFYPNKGYDQPPCMDDIIKGCK